MNPVKVDYREKSSEKIAILNMTVNDGDKIPWDKPIPSPYLDSICINGVWFERSKALNNK